MPCIKRHTLYTLRHTTYIRCHTSYATRQCTPCHTPFAMPHTIYIKRRIPCIVHHALYVMLHTPHTIDQAPHAVRDIPYATMFYTSYAICAFSRTPYTIRLLTLIRYAPICFSVRTCHDKMDKDSSPFSPAITMILGRNERTEQEPEI